jgi:hypothetical protein
MHVVGPIMAKNHDQPGSWQFCIKRMMEGRGRPTGGAVISARNWQQDQRAGSLRNGSQWQSLAVWSDGPARG